MPIIAVIGPSGAGKSTLVDMYIAKHPNAILHKTVTTRPRRGANDNSHTFITDAEFDALEREGKLIYSAPAYGFRYGMPALPSDTRNIVFVLLRAQFVPIFKQLYPTTKVIQMEAPADILVERLTVRSDTSRTDNVTILAEINLGRQYTNAIINTNLPAIIAYEEFEESCNVAF